MAKGIKDKVAILGMGCSKFGERWDTDADELMLEAYKEAIADAGIDAKQIDAAWFSTAIDEEHVGKSGIPLSTTLRLPNIPVTHVENMCATRHRGLPRRLLCRRLRRGRHRARAGRREAEGHRLRRPAAAAAAARCNDMWNANGTAPGNFAQLATAYRAKHGVDAEDLKKAIGHVSWKSHDNGAKNPKAHLQKAVDDGHHPERADDRLAARPVRLLRRVGRRRRAIVTTPEIAKALGKQNMVSVKALQLSVSNGSESSHNSWDGSYFHTTRIASKTAYEEAGIKNPRDEARCSRCTTASRSPSS